MVRQAHQPQGKLETILPSTCEGDGPWVRLIILFSEEYIMAVNIADKKKQMKEEIEKLQHELKIELPKRIAEARSKGDLKENAEYHAARERQSFVQAQISYLSKQLSLIDSIDISTIEQGKVDFGSVVTVRNLDNDEVARFTIVTPDEVDASEGKISLSSPIGRALHKKTVGDEVSVIIPAGTKRFRIEKLVTIHGEELSL